MALQRIHEHIVSLTQAADPSQHGVILSRQSTQADLTGLILIEIISKRAVREVPRKAHLGHTPNGDPILGRDALKDLKHVVGNHAINSEKRVLLHPGALLIGVATRYTLIALVEPQLAPRIADENFQLQRFPVGA